VLKKILLLLVLAPFIYFGLIMMASETGEVVVLESQNEQGELQSTRLWVVEHDGSMWLRAGDDQSGWYQRLMTNVQAGQAVYVTRDGERFSPSVVSDPSQAAAVNALMDEKYGLSNDAISFLMGEYRQDAVAVRLSRERSIVLCAASC
jgi:hypothetical protein